GLPFTRLHLSDLSLVEDDAAHHLHIEMAHADRATCGLAADRKSVDQELVEVEAILGLGAQGVRASAQAGVIQLLELRFERVDGLGHRQVALDFPFVRIEQLAEDDHWNRGYPARGRLNPRPRGSPARSRRASRRPA